jgi:hypothetical protein
MLVSAKKKPPKEYLNDNTKLLKISKSILENLKKNLAIAKALSNIRLYRLA